MTMMNKLIHTLFPRYRAPAVDRVYAVTFTSADNTVKTAGRTLKTFTDYDKAVAYWNKTIGEPHDKGTFRLVEKATLHECEAIRRQHAGNETHKGARVSGAVPHAPDDRPQDAASLSG